MSDEPAFQIDPSQVAASWLKRFESAMTARDPVATANLFLPDGFLRDVFILSWDTRTLQGRPAIENYLKKNFTDQRLTGFEVFESEYYQTKLDTSMPGFKVLDFTYTFETEKEKGHGNIKLMPGVDNDGNWKALSVFMTVADWKGYEEGKNPKRWAPGGDDPEVLIVGAGLCGLQHAARLMESGISCLLIDKAQRVGDTWRMRYPSLKLHIPRNYCEMLYQQYPTNYPMYMTKTHVADSLEAYVLTQRIPVWTYSFIDMPPTFDRKTKKWTIVINKGGERIIIKPSHLVMALSTFSEGVIPKIPGQDNFEGLQQHTDRYSGGLVYKDQRVVVVGTANSAQDICMDLVKEGAQSVTMIQRGPTCIRSAKYIADWIGSAYKDGVPPSVADFQSAAAPLKLAFQALRMQAQAGRDHDKVLLDGLKKVGFQLTDGPTDAGMLELGVTRGGGYSVDSGCSALLADGTIKLKSGAEILEVKERSIIFSDSSEIEADAIVYATGYGNIRETYKKVLGSRIVDRTSELWGLDEEGELRGLCRPTGIKNLWYAAGDFAWSRRTSKQLAILIKACQLGYCDL